MLLYKDNKLFQTVCYHSLSLNIITCFFHQLIYRVSIKSSPTFFLVALRPNAVHDLLILEVF